MSNADFLQKKIIPSRFLPNLIIFLTGVLLFFIFIDNKKISGTPALIFFGIAYMILGVGLYGMGKWLILNTIRLIIAIVRLILWGNVELTISKEKVSWRAYFK